ncbi:MAG TPA: VOC family protein [Ferrovibrio sp.]|uniref:VOC family protein n=1 Tax=Ferrovibrio sp. TaxID=1917215 RepID=UPI002ED551EC
MVRRILEEELQVIEEAVRRHSGGATAQQIADSLQEPPPRRTLQYRLKYLAEARHIATRRRSNAMPRVRQKITTFLWFDSQAEEAANFYTSLFDDSRVVDVARYTEANPSQEGSVMMVTFELAGQQFYALNAGQNAPFNESVSLLVECETQEEVDRLWSRLTEGGAELPCGWLKDRFGLAWQITPKRLLDLVRSPDRKVAAAAMRAMFEMKKIVIADIEKAVKSA